MKHFSLNRIYLIHLILAMMVAVAANLLTTASTTTAIPEPAPAQEPVYGYILGQLTDTFGRGVKSVPIRLTGPNNVVIYTHTDTLGGYSFTVPQGGPYRVTAPTDVYIFRTLRNNYPKPGWYDIPKLGVYVENLDFDYVLTSPWVPPAPTPTPGGGGGGGGGATPTPTPTPAPTPTPTPIPDGDLLNPGFEEGFANWQTNGLVVKGIGTGVTQGGSAAKLQPVSSITPVTVTQFVRLTPGATYELSADFYISDNRVRSALGVKWSNGGEGPFVAYNGGIQRNVKTIFTVGAGITQVGFQARATGSAGQFAIVDNFRFRRIS